MTSFSVACVQNCATDDMAGNLQRIEALVRSAVSDGADVICLPEFYCWLEHRDGQYLHNG